ncbi:hemerythrin domain-containing protein, partial [Solobacterium moorei]|uniref:hemerythrin domain-containing protein n=1 Tax=Solobacterium moorei TaxID=102148 RepID=UPI0028D5EDB2
MKEYLKNVNDEKLKTVFEVRNAYDEGKLTMEEARTILKEKVHTLEPYEVALIEQELKEEIDDECRKEDIQAMLDLFDGILNTSKPNLPKTHPIACYYRENEKMKELLLSVEDLVQYPVIKNQWFELYDQIIQWRKHLSRKQNQLYPVLEKKGFTRPTTTMWTLDDFIRDEITQAYNLIKEGKEDEFIELQSTVVADVRDLMQKEETVLYPTSLALISAEEFEHMKSGDQEIGFANITVEPTKT